jgi:hypothetical protein
MNARQRALLAYMQTVRPYLEGASSPEDMLRRVVRCMGEDVGVVTNGFLQAAVEHGKNLADQSMAHMTSVAARFIGKSFEDLLRGRHRR